MRKWFAPLVAACALLALAVGSASASASTAYFNLEEEPLPAGTDVTFQSYDMLIYSSFGVGQNWCYPEVKFTSEIGENPGNPVTLSGGTSSPEFYCKGEAAYKWVFKNFKVRETAKFFADGTGEIPISFDLHEPYYIFGSPCHGEGTLTFNWYKGTPSEPAEITVSGSSSAGKCGTQYIIGTFKLKVNDGLWDRAVEFLIEP